MEAKPEFLGRQFAESFEDESVAAAYQYRPTFPPQTFEILQRLMRGKPGRVLDAGAGTGALARPLVQMGLTVDAVDASRAMIAQGRRLPFGNHPRLHWIEGLAEDAPLSGPYSLIAAGRSLHWMDWAVVMPRFAGLLSPNGVLAILEEDTEVAPWREELLNIFRRYSTNRGFRQYDLIEELSRRGLFTEQGRQRTESVLFEQPLEEYVESFHARSSFSRQRMTARDAAAFDQAIRDLVSRYASEMVRLHVYADVVWGAPG